MLTWILYDTQFGNGKKLAELLQNELLENSQVKIGDVKEITPKSVADDSPDALILGGAIRMFRGAPKSKKWLKGLQKELNKINKKINYGAVFLTHGLPKDKIQGFVNRYYNKMKKANSIENIYSTPLTARVTETEGPICDEDIQIAKEFAQEFKNMLK